MKTDEEIDILLTADSKYIQHVFVVLKSLQLNDAGFRYRIHLIHDDLSANQEADFQSRCIRCGYMGFTYRISDDLRHKIPEIKNYPPILYYRMLAAEVLPDSIKKVIYLDADVLIINPLHPLWEMDMEDAAFMAAPHTEKHEIIDNINQIRMIPESSYFNTGVMVINLERTRTLVNINDIYAFLIKNAHELLMPDQDVFNGLYGHLTKKIPDEIWNYDTRKYSMYLRRNKKIDEGWIMYNTAVLHFRGTNKPWNAYYRYRFSILYFHYMNLSGIQESGRKENRKCAISK